MTASNFDACVAETLLWEGGFVNDPRDPGGATNWGITQATLAAWRARAVSVDEVRTLARDEAAAIYRARYWAVMGCDRLPAGLDLMAFDAAVNSGSGEARLWLDWASGSTVADRIRSYADIRLGFLRGLGTWAVFGLGWSRRVAGIEAAALSMAGADMGAAASASVASGATAGNVAAAGGAMTIGAAANGAAAGLGAVHVGSPWQIAIFGLVAAIIALIFYMRAMSDNQRAAAIMTAAKRAAAKPSSPSPPSPGHVTFTRAGE